MILTIEKLSVNLEGAEVMNLLGWLAGWNVDEQHEITRTFDCSEETGMGTPLDLEKISEAEKQVEAFIHVAFRRHPLGRYGSSPRRRG